MPVAPLVATTPPAVEGSPSLSEASASPADGFDELLSARLPAARALPSVPLGKMVAAFVAGPSLAPESAGLTAVADPWGVAADQPNSASSAIGAPAGPGAAVISAGERYLGVPYRWGGTDAATGFDCSGFVQQVYADLGVRLPRVSVDQARAGSPVASLNDAQPGDLVFWRASGGRPNHIGIYAGDGQMLVAPRTGDVVRYQDITRTPDAIRRVIT